MLETEPDRYNCIQITVQSTSAQQFEEDLTNALAIWKSRDIKAVWLSIDKEFSELIPVAAKLGFNFHNVKDNILTLASQLREGPYSLPESPTHYAGIGGVVINNQDEILVIKENQGPATAVWKIPGGLVDFQEKVHQAAMREVFEETGVQTNFEGILAFRDRQTGLFGRSDLYYIALLTPTSSEIAKCEREIAEATWMPISEILETPQKAECFKMLKLVLNGCTENIRQELLNKSMGQEVYQSDIYQANEERIIHYSPNRL